MIYPSITIQYCVLWIIQPLGDSQTKNTAHSWALLYSTSPDTDQRCSHTTTSFPDFLTSSVSDSCYVFPVPPALNAYVLVFTLNVKTTHERLLVDDTRAGETAGLTLSLELPLRLVPAGKGAWEKEYSVFTTSGNWINQHLHHATFPEAVIESIDLSRMPKCRYFNNNNF